MSRKDFELIARCIREMKPATVTTCAVCHKRYSSSDNHFEREHPGFALGKVKKSAAKGVQHEQWTATVNGFASALAQTNPRFDRERFITACGA